jgi:hypothetical protein
VPNLKSYFFYLSVKIYTNMKQSLFILFAMLISLSTFSQETTSYVTIGQRDPNSNTNNISQNTDTKNFAISIGFLHGGGSLIGADLEYLFSKRFGFQAGIGYVGFGFGINYHIKPNNISSSFISLQYMNQGMGRSHTQSVISPIFVFRARKIFTASLGLGFRVYEGPAFNSRSMGNTPVMLTYMIGVYFPL